MEGSPGEAGPRVAARAGAVGLGLVLLLTSVVLVQGLILRSPCASGDWADGRQYRRLCYTDIVPLFGTEQLQGGRIPYLQACRESANECDEYPVLTMFLMRGAATAAGGYRGFFATNAAILAALALATAALLQRLAGTRALLFALAPTLLVYAFVNWDLLAVALATGATWAHLRRRDQLSGVFIGLGAAAKLYPALLVIPFALGRLRRRQTGEAVSIAVWAVVAWAVVNLPFAVLAPRSWFTFFRFNGARPVDWDSLWFVACQRLEGGASCGWSPRLVDALSALAFVALAAIVYLWKRARRPEFPRWTFALPLLILFLLTSKVYSPQYGLWLLPWFALALPDLRLFAAFEAADVAVFVTRFWWFGRLSAEAGTPGFGGFGGVPLGAFEIAVVARAVVLVACLVAWILRDDDEGRLLRAPAPLAGAAATGPA